MGIETKHQKEIIDYDKRKKAGKEVSFNPSSEDGSDIVQNQPQIDSQMIKEMALDQQKTGSGIELNPKEREALQNQISKNSKAVKKVLGSGRVEKACDCVIGKRQKHKAMSFRLLGSRSLAMKENG